MGITRVAVRLFLDEARVRPFRGSILQLGRQAVCVDASEFEALRAKHHTPLPPSREPAKGGAFDDRALFHRLGFETVHSLDVSDYEHASIIADLNQPIAPEHHGKYDVIFDGGTLEHLFHVPNALGSIHAMLKPNGRIIHMAPTSNHIDHGFYSFSPVMFHDWYATNGYRLETVYLLTFGLDWLESEFTIYDYTPSNKVHVLGSTHCFDGAAATWCIARKLPDSTGDRIPIQFHYRTASASTNPASAHYDPAAAARLAGASRLKGALRDAPMVGRFFHTPAYRKMRAWVMKNVVVKKNFPPVHLRY